MIRRKSKYGPKSKLISILIRTKNEDLFLEEVLVAIHNQLNNYFEIVIVDSGSIDNTLLIAKKYKCKIFKILPKDFSFGKSLNYGIEKCNGDIVVILSGHCTPVDKDWLDNLVSPLLNGKFSASFGRQIARESTHIFEKKAYLDNYPSSNKVNYTNFSNANSAINKNCWKRLKFDPNVSGSEDILWARNLNKMGKSYCYVYNASVYHSHNENFKSVYNRVLRERMPFINCAHKGVYLSQILKMIFKSFSLLLYVMAFKPKKIQNMVGFYNFEIPKIAAFVKLFFYERFF